MFYSNCVWGLFVFYVFNVGSELKIVKFFQSLFWGPYWEEEIIKCKFFLNVHASFLIVDFNMFFFKYLKSRETEG